MAPTVPGYRTGRLLGFGASGEVWSAVTEDGGEPVALKVLRSGDDDRLARETAVLRRVVHPHVVRLRAVEHVEGWGRVLVLDRAMGGSLAALVTARGRLDVGEVVTVLTPLAEALAELHGRGIVHGDVAPGNVLFDEQGRPLLSDLGLASLAGVGPGRAVHGTPGYADPARIAGTPAGPASDVHGLAAVGWLALTGRAPLPVGERPPLVTVAPHVPADLAAVLEAGLDPDPPRRPGATELAGRCFDSAPAEPVRLVPTDPAAAPAEVVTHRLRAAAAAAAADADEGPARGRHRSGEAVSWRRLPLLVAAAVAVLLVTVGAVAVPRIADRGDASATDGTAAPTAPAAPVADAAEVPAAEIPAAVEAALTGQNPRAAVPALAWLRARAFTTGEAAFLRRAGVAGGEALEADLRTLETLRGRASVLDGLGFHVRRTDVVREDGEEAVVDVSVVTSAHREVDSRGGVVTSVPQQEARLSRLVLRRGDRGWQVDRLLGE